MFPRGFYWILRHFGGLLYFLGSWYFLWRLWLWFPASSTGSRGLLFLFLYLFLRLRHLPRSLFRLNGFRLRLRGFLLSTRLWLLWLRFHWYRSCNRFFKFWLTLFDWLLYRHLFLFLGWFTWWSTLFGYRFRGFGFGFGLRLRLRLAFWRFRSLFWGFLRYFLWRFGLLTTCLFCFDNYALLWRFSLSLLYIFTARTRRRSLSLCFFFDDLELLCT